MTSLSAWTDGEIDIIYLYLILQGSGQFLSGGVDVVIRQLDLHSTAALYLQHRQYGQGVHTSRGLSETHNVEWG